MPCREAQSNRKHRGRLRAASLAAAAAVLLPACRPAGPAGTATASADTLDRAKAFRGEFQRELLLTGELQAVHAVMVNAPQTSIFQMRITFMAEEGEFVAKGDPLLDFDNSALADRVLDLETQILDAETQVVAKQNEIASALKDLEIELAEKEYEQGRTRLEAEVDPGILSRKEYGDRRLAFEKADRELKETRDRVTATRERGQAELDVLVIQRDKLKHDLQSAQNDLDLLSIKAPSDGLVIYEARQGSSARFQEGDSCWPGQRVMRLPDLSEMQVAFNVSEVDARLLKPGMPITITMDSFPDRTLTGSILQIPSMAVNRQDDSKVRIFKVISSLSETLPGVMKPGMSVQGRIVVETREDAAMVSRDLVRFDGEKYWLRPSEPRAESGPVEIHPVARNGSHYVLDDQHDQQALALLGITATPREVTAQSGTPATGTRS